MNDDQKSMIYINMSEVIKPENFRLVTMTQNLQNPKKVVKLIEKYQFVSQNQGSQTPQIFIRFVNRVAVQAFLLMLAGEDILNGKITANKGQINHQAIIDLQKGFTQNFRSLKTQFQQLANTKRLESLLKDATQNQKISYYMYEQQIEKMPSRKKIKNQQKNQQLYIFLIQEKDHFILASFTSLKELSPQSETQDQQKSEKIAWAVYTIGGDVIIVLSFVISIRSMLPF